MSLPLGEHDRVPPLLDDMRDVAGDELVAVGISNHGPVGVLDGNLPSSGHGKGGLPDDNFVIEVTRSGLLLGVDDEPHGAELHLPDGVMSVPAARCGPSSTFAPVSRCRATISVAPTGVSPDSRLRHRTLVHTTLVEQPEPVLAVRFYRAQAGGDPVRKWLRSLPREVRRTIDSQEDAANAGIGRGACQTANEGGHMTRTKDELQEFFEDLGEWEEVLALARKKMIADDLRGAMKARKIGPSEMARRMRTSRQAVYRLLDPEEPGATLDTLARASVVLGLDLEVRLIPRVPQKALPRKAPRRPTKRAA